MFTGGNLKTVRQPSAEWGALICTSCRGISAGGWQESGRGGGRRPEVRAKPCAQVSIVSLKPGAVVRGGGCSGSVPCCTQGHTQPDWKLGS